VTPIMPLPPQSPRSSTTPAQISSSLTLKQKPPQRCL
jgi:hypothetical protein